jgi:hypothetical protein
MKFWSMLACFENIMLKERIMTQNTTNFTALYLMFKVDEHKQSESEVFQDLR